MRTYFGFAIADGMFDGNATVTREVVTPETAKAIVEAAVAEGSFVSSINASHVPTVDAMCDRYGINVAVPTTPPKITLAVGDCYVVMSVRGLGRLEGRTQYTADEIAQATFAFSIWTRSA